MRLTKQQADYIHDTIIEVAGSDAEIYLFGSRLNDNKRGGDVDLFVQTKTLSLMDELLCKISLEEGLGLPVDLIVRTPDGDSVIAQIAKIKGQRL